MTHNKVHNFSTLYCEGHSPILLILKSNQIHSGLVAFIANQKQKEIGIRKVLGASVTNIMRRFSTEFLILVGIAFLIAAPVSYLLLNGWLSQYEYRIPIGPAIFLISLGASVFIALGTTSYRSLKAATANPVNSLRDD